MPKTGIFLTEEGNGMKEKLTSRDIQARQTREKLLRTAMELIAEEGYRNVTISRICKECGVSVGTFTSISAPSGTLSF